jgi:endonuclease/exonuclease/phosphatase family metal-dependent hydrolase
VEARIASWNIESRGSDYEADKRGTAAHILRGIQQLNADILVLPDAFAGEAAPVFDAGMREQGYGWRDVLYGDEGRDWTLSHTGVESGMRVATRWEIVDVEEVRWGMSRRRMIVMMVRNPASGGLLRVIGMHLDDRTEEHREEQIKGMAGYLNSIDEVPTIAMGDFNAVHGSDLRARFLGSTFMRWMARNIPSRTVPPPGDFADDIRGFAMRGTDMMSGRALRQLEERTNLRDLDPKHRATATLKLHGLHWLPSWRILQLDHMFATPDIATDGIKVWPDGGSDHRAISAVIRVSD